MTVKELLSEVSALGFGTELGSSLVFISALNRSLRRLFGERRVMGEHSFYATSKSPVTYYSHLSHVGGKRERFPISGDAFSVYAHGCGTLTVFINGKESIFGFDGQSVRIVGMLGGSGEIELSGAGSSYLTDLVSYSDVASPAEQIHDGSPIVKYRARDMVCDFHSFLGVPTDKEGMPIPGVGTVGDTVYVPMDHTGRIFFRYLRAPIPVTGADMDRELELPPDCEEALALLVASYVYLESDKALAEKYGEQYREAMSRAPMPAAISYGTAYRDTNGWA